MVAKSKPAAGKMQCVYCKEWVTTGATRCPHCQAEYTADDQRRMERHQKKTGAIGCGVLAAVIILGASLVSTLFGEEIPEEPTATAKQDALEFYKRVYAAGIDCDNSFSAVARELGGSDPIAAYRAAEDAEGVCLTVGADMRAIEVPTSVGKALHAQFLEARGRCDDAYVSKWAMLKDMRQVLGEGGNVAKLASMQSNMEATQSQAILCAAGLAGPLTELGLKSEELTQ